MSQNLNNTKAKVTVANLFTIDPPNAHRLDDAFNLMRTKDGWLLQIAICNVASEVVKDSDEDKKARELGQTHYYKHKPCKHMLPMALVHDRTSLLEGKKREVILTEIPLTADFQVGSPTFSLTEVEIQWNFDFQTVDQIVNGNLASPFHSVMNNLNNLAKALHSKRIADGALSVFEPSIGLASSEEGLLYLLDENTVEINLINYELGYLLNSLCAQFVHGKGLPMIYRNHEVSHGQQERKTIQKAIARFINQESVIEKLSKPNWLEDRLGIATHGTECLGHFGLNLSVYGNFISPLRQYSDLVNQRILKAAIKSEEAPYTHEELKSIVWEINYRDPYRFIARHNKYFEILDGGRIETNPSHIELEKAVKFRKLNMGTKKQILGRIH